MVGLPGGVSFEGWYEFLWNPLRLDTVGTFFSGSDYFGPGGNYQVLGGEYDKLIKSPSSVSSAVTNGTIMLRGNDDQPSNQGQFGLKAGYYADWLNDGTDFGLYFTNFHSAFPVLAFTAPTASLLKIGTKAFASQRYLSQYPSDIHQIGASFNTTLQDLLGGTALAGEVAYSPNMPFQRAVTSILGQDVGVSTTGDYLASPGDIMQSFKRKASITGQLQTTSTLPTSNTVTDFLGADLTVLLANAGFQYLPNTNGSIDQLNITRSDQYSINPLVDSVLGSGQCPGGLANGVCQGAKYASAFSWGYRLMFSPQYNNAFGTPFTISPLVVWSHDVTGYSAGPIGPGFIAGVKKVSLGFNGSYLNSWNLNVQWTSAFGNKFRNNAYDKDFASMTLSYSF